MQLPNRRSATFAAVVGAFCLLLSFATRALGREGTVCVSTSALARGNCTVGYFVCGDSDEEVLQVSNGCTENDLLAFKQSLDREGTESFVRQIRSYFDGTLPLFQGGGAADGFGSGREFFGAS